MLTIKLQGYVRTNSSQAEGKQGETFEECIVVEAEKVSVQAMGLYNHEKEVKEITVLRGDKSEVFYIAKSDTKAYKIMADFPFTEARSKAGIFSDDAKIYNVAYVENSRGSTVLVVRPE
jgi:hypothetical protein